jgi:hypothetical protein
MSLLIRRALGLAGLAMAAALGTAQAQAPSLTVSGVGYAQFLYQLHQDTLGVHQNAFDVTRAYVNVIGKFPEGIYTRVTLDIDGRRTDARQQTFRLKYAYVAWTPEKSPLTFKLGEIHTPWLDWEEALWDYRMQGTMAMERGGYLSSSDFGAGIDGNWAYDKVNMQVGVYNGENYNGGLGDQRKDLMGRVSVKLLNTDQAGRVGGLRLTAYGQYGKPTGSGQRERFIGMLSYKSKMVTLAAEYGATKDSTTGTSTASVTGRVLSGYGVLNVPNSKVAIIGRVDIIDPNTGSSATNDRLTRVIGGISYQVGPNLRVLADIDNVSHQGGNTPLFDATRTQGLFQAQLTF